MAVANGIATYPDFVERLKSIGDKVKFATGVTIIDPEHLSIGDNTFFNVGVHIQAGPGVTVGSETHFAPFCVLYGPLEVGNKCAVAAHTVFASVGHTHDDPEVAFVDAPAQSKKIVVEDNVWIGANAVIIGGVRIGTGSIVAAGAVVTHDVQPYSVVGGVPARLLRKRK
jgi:galactoside O-acetyltransferase